MFDFAIVEDINDPQKLGRVRVRVFGHHTHDKVLIPTDSLPWATVVQPTTSAANSGVGTTPRLLNGSMVMVVWADGKSHQFPIVIGSVPGEIQEHLMTFDGNISPRGNEAQGFQDPDKVYPTENYIGENDLPKHSRDSTEFERTQFTTSNTLFGITEPEDLRSNHVYPHNQVKQSTSGHYEEWDDTPSNERLGLSHKSGTFREIRPDGTKVEKIVGSSYKIIAEGENVYVEGVCNLHVNSNCNTYIKGDWNIQVDGSMDLDVKNVITMDSKEGNFYLNQDRGNAWAAARKGDTADTGDAGTGSHFDTNSAGTDLIETGSGSVFIGK